MYLLYLHDSNLTFPSFFLGIFISLIHFSLEVDNASRNDNIKYLEMINLIDDMASEGRGP